MQGESSLNEWADDEWYKQWRDADLVCSFGPVDADGNLRRGSWSTPVLQSKLLATGRVPVASSDTGGRPVSEITIGESFSWIVVGDGEVREITGVLPEGLPIITGPLNEEQKARWARICNQHE